MIAPTSTVVTFYAQVAFFVSLTLNKHDDDDDDDDDVIRYDNV